MRIANRSDAAAENGPFSAATELATPRTPATPGRLASGEGGTFSAMTALVTRPRASFEAALDDFYARPDLARLTVRTYRLTLERLAGALAERQAGSAKAPEHGPG